MAEGAKQRGLGRGLAALVAEFPSDQTSLVDVDLTNVRANSKQPRRVFDDDALKELAESIKAEGVVQPIVVRESGGGYEIIAGERRWRAAQVAGLRTIPAVVRRSDDRDSLVLAMAENVARVDLNPVDQARGYAVLSDELDLTQAEIARRVGKSRAAVANTMRLLELPDPVLDLISSGSAERGSRPGDPSGRGPGRTARAGAQGGAARTLGAPDRGRGQARAKAQEAQAGRRLDGRRAGQSRRGCGMGVAEPEGQRTPRAAGR